MAYIRRRLGKYLVMVRRVGFTPVTKTFTTLRSARQFAKEVEANYDNHFLIYKPNQKYSLKDIVYKYIKEVVVYKKSRRSEEYVLRHFLRIADFTSLVINDVRPFHWAKHRDARLQTIKPASLKREFAIYKHMYQTCIRVWELNISNPLDKITLPKITTKLKRRFKDFELTYLIKKAGPEFSCFIELLLETCMRRGELLRVRQKDIKGRLLTIHQTKINEPRTIPLSYRALVLFRKVRLPFQLKAEYVTHKFKELARKGAFEDVNLHQLRHEGISRLFEKGLSVPEVALISGHKGSGHKMLFHYTHLKPENVLDKLKAKEPFNKKVEVIK